MLPLSSVLKKYPINFIKDSIMKTTFTPDERTWLTTRVKALQGMTELLCQEKMQSFLEKVNQKKLGDDL